MSKFRIIDKVIRLKMYLVDYERYYLFLLICGYGEYEYE